MNESGVRQRKKSTGDGKPRKVKVPHNSQISNAQNHNVLWARSVLFVAIAIIVYLRPFNREKTFATQKETVELRTQKLDCLGTLHRKMEYDVVCDPTFCGRFVTDTIVTREEVDILLNVARSVFQFGHAVSNISLFEPKNGILTNNRDTINIYDLPEAKDIFTTEHINTYKQVREKIQQAISDYFKINSDSIFLTDPTYFMRISYQPPEHEGFVTKREAYLTYYYTAHLFLSDFSKDFKGGRHMFRSDPFKRNETNVYVEEKRGRVSVFSTGLENDHYIETVTSGVGYSLVFFFTCDKKYAIEDPQFVKEEEFSPK